jgi:hypothetical protein
MVVCDVMARPEGEDMDASVVTALAAVGGSVVGGLTSFLTTVLTQRSQGRRERLLRELDRREDLYTLFDQTGSELMFDSIGRELEDPSKLISLMALTGRIRLASTAPVLAAAEALIADILDSYRSPPADPAEVLKTNTAAIVDPLIRFTEACRAERMEMLSRL